MRKLRILLALGKPRLLALICLLAVAGVLLAPRPAPGPAAMAALAAALLWLGTALIAELTASTINAIDDALAGTRPPAATLLRPSEALRWGLGLQAAGMALVLAAGSRAALLLALLGAGLGNAYSLPPFRLCRSGGVASLVLGAGAALTIAVGALMGGGLTSIAVITALALGALAAATSLVKDFRDPREDAEDGLRTLPMLLGHNRAALVAIAASGCAHLVSLVAMVSPIGLRPVPTAAALCLAGAHLYVLDRLRRSSHPQAAEAACTRSLVIFLGVTLVHVTAQSIY